MGLPQRDPARHTYADYCSWPENIRYELVDGIAYLMSPAPSTAHQDMLGELFYQVRNALEGKRCRPYLAPFDVRIPRGNEADERIDTVVQPDLLVICDRSRVDARGLRGTPDWVVEVLSPTTAAHDQTRKLAAYERAGVPEVWLVHPTDRVLTVYRLENRVYGRPHVQELEGERQVESVPGISIDWDKVLERLKPDDATPG